MKMILLILWLTACGQVYMPLDGDATAPDAAAGADSVGNAGDAMVGGANVIDAAPPDAPRPPPTGVSSVAGCPTPEPFYQTWGAPVLVSLSTTDYRELGPSISCDGLEIFFYKNATSMEVYSASRASVGAPWSNTRVVGFGSGDERGPELVPGGRDLYFDRGLFIYRARRSAPGQLWVEKEALFSGQSPTVRGDGVVMYYLENYKLKRRRRADLDSGWGTPEEIPVPGGWHYQKVTVSADGATRLLLSPVEASAPRVLANRGDSWTSIAELADMKSCDFFWQGDLVCSDSHDVYYFPNAASEAM